MDPEPHLIGPGFRGLGPGFRGYPPGFMRRAAQRVMFGEYVLFGVAGSALSWRLLPAQLAQIERFYHVRNAEMLSESPNDSSNAAIED